MDELIDHCVRELSFDGDLGCSVSRLREFVVQYFASHHAMRQQVVDDSYFAFVWSVLVQQPMVRVGTVPPGVATEVYIAPQTKAKAAKLEADQPAPATSLDLVEDAQTKSLEELQTLYGDALRIAVDPTTSFVAITGSHTRPSKMSGMVYTALQLISRGRERGLSVVDLGKKTGYDQKSCFYLVKQLLELNLVVKLRQGGVGTNFCVHRHFYETGAIWTEIREHEAREQAEAEAVEEGAPGVQFDPIDKNHLISLPFVKARLVKLLKQCANHIHPVNGLIKAMGFANPTKEDRRFFQGRLKELTEQGVIERILVPNVNKRSAKAEIPCIRLIAEHGVEQTPTVEGAGAVAGPSTAMEGVSGKAPGALKVGVMLHRQIIDLLVEAGTKGLVLNEISSALDNFDKRTIELLLNRLEANPPPPHLSDLGVAQLMETYGRERRYRYYTVASYRTIVEREKLDDSDSKYAKADFSNVGGFAPIDADMFYENDKELVAAVEGMAGNVGPAKKIGRPRKSEVKGKEPARPRGRPRKRKLEEEAGGDVSIVEAEAIGEGPSAKKRRTAKKAEAPSTTDVAMAEEGAQEGAQGAVEIAEPPPPKRKRGRPPKKKPVPAREPPEYEELVSAIGESSAQVAEGATTAEQGAAVGESSTVRPATPAPRKRGRPRKNPLPTTPAPPAGNEKAGEYSSAPVPSSAPPKRGRGRPRKHPLPPPVSSPAPEQQPDPPTTVTADQAAEPAREGDATADITTTITSPLIHPNVSEVSQPQGTEDEEQLSVTTDTPRRSQRKSKAVVREEHATPVKSMKGKEKAVEMPPPSAPSPQPEPMDVDQVVPSVTNETGSSSQVAEPEMSTFEHPQLEAAAGPSEDIAMGAEGGVAADQQPTSQQADIPIDPALVLEDFTTTPQIQQPDSVDASLEPAQAIDEAQHKRTASESADPAQPSKRQKLEDPGKVRSRGNVSLLRRENEFLRVLEELGGITYSSAAEFIDAHLALLESMAAAGEATSGLPGLKVDKRTVTSTLDDMEERGKIKTFQTAIRLPTGPQKQVRIMYLPTIAKEQLDTYVAELGRGLPTPQQPVVKRVEEEIKYGRELAEPHRRTLPLDLLQRAKLADYQGNPIHPEAVDELFQREDQDIRDTLLTERSIVSQLHGFISGKALRARELHLYTLRSFEEQPNSFHIVSAEERIVNLSFYSNDIPLAVFCALVSTLTHDEQLIQLLLSEEGRRMLVKNLPLDLYSVLSVGRTRTRSRLLDLFELLQGIGLVTPLQRTESATPFLRCTPKNEHYSAFDVFTETWSPQSSINSPAYWRFNAEAPIHLWSISEDSPAFWKNMPIRTLDEATAYWEDLCKVCLDREFAASITCPPTGMRPQSSIEATARSIRRKSSWKSSYDLSPIQQHYLNRFFNQSTGQTPLQDQDGGATTLERIAWVISAPLTAVTEWFRESHARYVHRIERAEHKPRPNKAVKAEKAARRAAEEQQLVEKAANARAQREQDWQGLVQRLHPEPMDDMTAARIGRIRNLFMDSGTRADNKKWEREVSRALQDAKTAEEMRLVTSQKKVATIVRPPSRPGALSKAAPSFKGTVPPARGPPPPVAATAPGKSVAELIADQGPVRHQKKAKKRSKKAKEEPVDEGSPIPTVRRHRFQWNREYDELARDACVIVRARCRGGRKDWSALAQVFPGLVPNSVRQHFNQLTVGSETYLKRLEDRWYELWVQHRGSEALPDPNPESLSDFDLAAHVEFLRRHIDKNALRVGFVSPQEMQNSLLPSSLAQIESSFDVIEKLPNAPTWDFMWSLNVDEGREKGMLQQSFVRGEDDVPVTFDNATDYVRTAEAALKMVFGTPNENYDASAAAELLHDIGEQPISVAQGNLLTRGVLSKLVRDLTKPKPGRTLKISEVNQNALGGAIASDTFQDAATLETLCEEQEDVWREWPLLSTDGDTAALLQAVSDGKVDFTVDVSQPRAARALLDWNSKKADDDHIETAISVKFHDITALPEQPGLESSPVQRESAAGDHGKTTDGNPACCRESSEGIIDCEACLTTERASLTTRLNENDQRLGDLILARLQEAGSEGLTKMALMEYLPGYTYDEIWTVVGKFLDSSVPLIHFTGYSSLVMVPASHMQPWTVIVSSEPLTRVLPRRWLDIRGSKMADVWEAALHAVIGVIIFRPGIRQSEIRWRLRAVYDRQEIIEMLQSLSEEGFIKRRLAPGLREPPSALMTLDDEEEKQTFWVLGDRHWYQA